MSTNRWRCPSCSNTYTRKFNLDAHLRTHTNERPYRCEFCPLAFTRKHDLNAHQTRHRGGTRHVCTHSGPTGPCRKSFTRASTLKRHQKTQHTSSQAELEPMLATLGSPTMPIDVDAEPTVSSREIEMLVSSAVNGQSSLYDLAYTFVQDSNRTLHDVLERGLPISVIQTIVQNTENIDKKDESGWSPIHHAAGMSDAAYLKLLLDKGADPNAITEASLTPLHLACWDGHAQNVLSLLERGANIEAKDASHRTALFHAVSKGNFDCLETLLTHGANLFLEDTDGDTLLHVACQRSSSRIVQKLLERGIRANVANQAGATALHFWVRDLDDIESKIEILRLLSRHGADFDATDNKGLTPLLNLALQSNPNPTIFHELLKRGAKANATDEQGRTALHLLSIQYDALVAKKLKIANEASIIGDEFEVTSITRIIKMLVEHGADVNAKAHIGRTPLLYHLSGSYPAQRIVRALMKHGADSNYKNISGEASVTVIAKKIRDSASNWYERSSRNTFEDATDLKETIQRLLDCADVLTEMA